MAKYPKIQPTTIKPVPQFSKPQAITPPAPVVANVVSKFDNPSTTGVPVIGTSIVGSAEWNFQRILNRDNWKVGFSRMDCYFASLFARAAFTNADEVHSLLAALLSGDGYSRHEETVEGVAVKWFEYRTGPFRVIAFPGTSNLQQWWDYTDPRMVQDPDYPAGSQVFAGLKKYLHANYSAFTTYYASQIAANFPCFCLIGHSLGGAIASHIARRVDSLAPDTGSKPFNSMISCYTFGAPAYSYTPDDVDVQAPKVRVIRTVNPGDMVPDATQDAVRWANGLAVQVTGRAYFLPEHYATKSWLINGRVPRKLTFWDAMAKLRKGPIEATKEELKKHLMRAYANELEKVCVEFSDAPYPNYSMVRSAHRQLELLGG